MPLGINDLADDSHKSAIPEELKSRRSRLKLSRREVADALGVDPSTLQRWEMDPSSDHHRRIPADDYRRLIAFYDERDKTVGRSVPRGTIAREPAPRELARRPAGDATLPRPIRLMALDFERYATAVGADEAFLRYVRSSFADPNFTALFAGGPDESPMTEEEEREEMEAVVAEMRALLTVRLRHARERNPELGKDMRTDAPADKNADPPPGRRRIGEVIPDPRIAAAEAEREAKEAAKARRNSA